jgi:hypothetical protein
LALNLLIIHPQLRLTICAVPSVTVRVERELKSERMNYLYETTKDPRDGSVIPAVIDRVQIIHFSSPELDALTGDLGKMDKEATYFTQLLPAYMSELFKSTGLFTNKFADIPPSFAMFDVSQAD